MVVDGDTTIDETGEAIDDDYADAVTITSSNYLQVLDGWFKAPATADYVFYMSCDDKCQLEFDATNYYGSGSDPSMTTLMSQTSAMNFRNYFIKSNGFYSTT